MTSLKVANLYHSLYLHFNTESYDAIKYNFKSNKKIITQANLYTFDKLYKRYKKQILAFFISNFIINSKTWIHELLSETCHENYITWKTKYESLSYVFENDVKRLFEQGDLKKVLTVQGNYPIIIQDQWKGKMELESLLILDHYFDFLNGMNEEFKDDLIWPTFFLKCRKYRRFLSFDEKKCLEILKREIGG